MKLLKTLLPTFLSIILLFSHCNGEGGQNKKGIDITTLQHKKRKLTYTYYQKWDDKLNKPVLPFSKSEKKKYKSYIKAGFNKHKQIALVIKYVNNKKKLKLQYYHNDRGNLRIKIAYFKLPHIGKIKEISEYNPLGTEVKRESFVKFNGKYTKYIVKVFNHKGLVTQIKIFDEDDGKLKARSELTYSKLKLTKKRNFSRDIKIAEVDKSLYLHSEEFFNKTGKLEKKIYYNQEEKTLGHYSKYKYHKGNTTILSYNSRDKLIGKTILNKQGKQIHAEIYDFDGKNREYDFKKGVVKSSP